MSNKSEITSMKKCYRCKEIKNVSEFTVGINRISSYCKKCNTTYSTEWYKANGRKKPSIEQNKIEYQKRKEKIREWIFLNGLKGISRRSNYGKQIKMNKPGLLTSDICGICAMCGEPLIFGQYHHILGSQNEFTVLLCGDCHSSDMCNINQHCMSIGRRIEWGYLTTINHTEDTN